MEKIRAGLLASLLFFLAALLGLGLLSTGLRLLGGLLGAGRLYHLDGFFRTRNHTYSTIMLF